jgi:hypothetical protein
VVAIATQFTQINVDADRWVCCFNTLSDRRNVIDRFNNCRIINEQFSCTFQCLLGTI